MKFIKPLVAIMITAFMLSISVCYADTVDVIKLKDVEQDASQRETNLRNMIEPWRRDKTLLRQNDYRNVNDYGSVGNLLEFRMRTREDINHLTDFVTLLSKMESAKDKSAVNAFISSQLYSLKENCPHEIAYLNGVIVGLENSALVAESQYLRDDFVKRCDIVQHWK